MKPIVCALLAFVSTLFRSRHDISSLCISEQPGAHELIPGTVYSSRFFPGIRHRNIYCGIGMLSMGVNSRSASKAWVSKRCSLRHEAPGSIRRECLDHVVMLNDRHLKRILTRYFNYYHYWRTHLSLGMDSPESRLRIRDPRHAITPSRRVRSFEHS